MNRHGATRILLLCALAAWGSQAFGWGYEAHKLITRKACDAMPEPVRGFFISHSDELAERSLDPDSWRKTDKLEHSNHFLDIDYSGFGPYPFSDLPRSYAEASAKFGEEALDQYGRLPWRIDRYMEDAVRAIKSGDPAKVVGVLGAYSHYIEDAHMPLHVVMNFNGQLTGQRGVHGRWEWNMVDRHLPELSAAVLADPSKVAPVEQPLETAFEIIFDSYGKHFALLDADRHAAAGIEGDLEESDVYFDRLWRRSNELCIAQMTRAAEYVASFWTTAWERAGKPKLPADVPARRERARDLGIRIGSRTPGPLNAITDVLGVRVGHVTHVRGSGKNAVRTGVTAIVPRDDIWHRKAPAAVFAMNSNGEVMGSHWIREAGSLEVPIVLTTTLNVPAAAAGVVEWMVRVHPSMGRGDDVVLPVVAECDDSGLNDSQARAVTAEDTVRAIETSRSGPAEEGSVGAGTGLRSYGFKGGIGTASRVIEGGYTVGALVEANGGRRSELRVDGVPVGEEIADLLPTRPDPEKSFIVVVATDAPLDARQLERVAKRASWGIARTGTVGRHGSGDFVIAFSTANPMPHMPDEPTYPGVSFVDAHINELFAATIEATEEAIVNALVAAETMVGYGGATAHELPSDRLRAILYRHGRLFPSSTQPVEAAE
ncbi:hypothetical protein FJZ36_00605 [Candidatus Poribacteria bacterium]|nr:hypothetical protein [Candidatus Poribacteria bacterium]